MVIKLNQTTALESTNSRNGKTKQTRQKGSARHGSTTHWILIMQEIELARLHPRFLTPFRWDVFWQKQRVMMRQNGVLSTLPSIGFHLGVYLFNQIGWGIDGVFPSNVSTPQIDDSVFIVGHQRSGTTFLHRLMAQNDWAHSLDLHEMLFPASSFKRGIQLIDRIDSRMGSPLLNRFNALQKTLRTC